MPGCDCGFTPEMLFWLDTGFPVPFFSRILKVRMPKMQKYFSLNTVYSLLGLSCDPLF